MGVDYSFMKNEFEDILLKERQKRLTENNTKKKKINKVNLKKEKNKE